jgi:uroporphyrin-III C-methyltransferase
METNKPSSTIESDAEWAANLEPRPTPRSGGKWLSGLALILSVTAFCGSVYLWYALVYQRGLLKTDVPGAIERLDKSSRELNDAVADTDNQIQVLRDTQDTLKTALDKIQADLSRNRSEWVINEAEQLLMIANRRLQIARDINTALTALRAADRQLELTANPNLLPVRRQVSREIARLESIERMDIAGMTLTIASLADNIERWPLLQEAKAAPASNDKAQTAETEGRWPTARRVWQDLLSLVRIRYEEASDQPLLAPEQEYFARENLRLMLYGAQHALLQGNIATYQQNLDTAIRWLRTYFDKNSQPVALALQELERLRKTPMMTEIPDISASLEMLRKAAGRKSTP